MEFVYDLCLSKDAELSLSGQQDYVTKIGTWFGEENSSDHGINIATYDDDGNLVGGVVDFNGHEIRNAEITNTTIKLPSPNQVIVQTVTNTGLKVEYPVKFPKYESTLATTDDLGYVKNPLDPDGNGNYYGYYGSLENLGINEAYVDVKSISYKRRTDSHSTDPSATDYIKARIMRRINGAWTIYSESKQWLKPESFPELGSNVGEFTMQKVQGAGPLSNKELIGIIFVIANATHPGNRPLQLGMSVSASGTSASGMGIATGPLWIEQGGVPKMDSRLPLLTLKYNVDQVYEQLTNEEISRITTLQNVFDNSLGSNNKIYASLGTTSQGASLVIDSNKSNSNIIIGDSTSGSQTNATEFFSIISASNANDIRLNANEGLSLGVGLKGFVSSGTLPNTIQPNSFGIFASGTNGSASIMSGSTLAGSSVVAYTQFGNGNITSYAPNVMTIQGNAMLMASSDNLLLTGNQNIVMTSNGYNNNVNGSMSIDVDETTTVTSNRFKNFVTEFQIEIVDGCVPSQTGVLCSKNNGLLLNNSAFYIGSRRDPECSCLSLHVLGNAFIAGVNDKLPEVINSFNGTAWGFDTDLRLYGKNKVLIGRSEVLVPNVGADDIGGQYLSNYEQSGFVDSEGNPDPTHYSRAISSDTLCQFMTTRMSGQGISYDSTAKNYYVPILSNNNLGIAKTGGNGITTNSEGVLSILNRASHSGFDFTSDKRIFINTAGGDLHPLAGCMAPVVTDTAGKLAVGPDDYNAQVIVNKTSDPTPAAGRENSANQHGWIGTLRDLGVESPIFNSVTLYRRSGNTPNVNTEVYLRFLKRENNQWVVFSQSLNKIRFGSVSVDAGPIKFYMKSTPFVEPPSLDDVIAMTVVSSPTDTVTSSIHFGAKVITTGKGSLPNEFSNYTGASGETYNNFRPAVSIVWIRDFENELVVAEEKIATLETSLSEANQKISALESALGGLKLVQLTQSEYDALTTKDANTLYFIKEESTTTTTTDESEA